MKQTTLVFPNSEKLLNFIFENVIYRAQVESSRIRLTAALTDEEISTAYAEYGARISDRLNPMA